MTKGLHQTTSVPTPEGDVQAETELEIPLEDNKENAKSETKSPKVKNIIRRRTFDYNSFQRRASERSAEVQHGNTTES